MFDLIEGIFSFIEAVVMLITHGNKWVWLTLLAVIIIITAYFALREEPVPEPAPEPAASVNVDFAEKAKETFKIWNQ